MKFSDGSDLQSIEAIPTGIAALDRAGLAWKRGSQHLVLGTHRSGRTAVLLEFALRHIEMHSSNRVLLITEHPADTVLQRLFEREALRLAAELPDPDEERTWFFPSPRAHLARLHIQAMVDRRRLQVMSAPTSGSGIRFHPILAMANRPTLVIVDGYAVARTPLDRIREMIRCSTNGGQGTALDAPPIVLSVSAQAKAGPGDKEWPALPRWEREHLLWTAETTILLQRFAEDARALFAHISWSDPETDTATVRLEIDEAGAISTP